MKRMQDVKRWAKSVRCGVWCVWWFCCHFQVPDPRKCQESDPAAACPLGRGVCHAASTHCLACGTSYLGSSVCCKPCVFLPLFAGMFRHKIVLCLFGNCWSWRCALSACFIILRPGRVWLNASNSFLETSRNYVQQMLHGLFEIVRYTMYWVRDIKFMCPLAPSNYID